MINSKPAIPDHPISEVIANRWSPLAFTDKPVEKDKVMSLLEAARWAPSSFNEQPWNYIVGHQGDEIHSKLEECLVEGNSWAKKAPILMLSIAKTFFERKHKPNRHRLHDTGAASAYMALQATELDLIMHQMAGFDDEKARQLFNISDDFEPAAMIAIGYPGDEGKLSDDLKARQKGPRIRRNAEDLIWS